MTRRSPREIERKIEDLETTSPSTNFDFDVTIRHHAAESGTFDSEDAEFVTVSESNGVEIEYEREYWENYRDLERLNSAGERDGGP